jgi:DsbC/DsbD-like thiol-disulfide interchange protein
MAIRHMIGVVALAVGLTFAFPSAVPAQGKKSDSVVKARAAAEKPDKDGKQVVTVTLDIDPKYHVYANPVGQSDFADNQTTITITGKEKLASVKVDYPAGEKVEDKVVGDYMVYKGKVDIKAVVQRAKGDNGPLDVAVKVQACSKTSCLLPATIKVSVP